MALETRWNLLAPQYVCEREECVLHPVLQKSPAHTQSGTRGPPPPTHRMQTLSLADNKKGERIFYVIITSTFKVERIIVKFYERWCECTPLRYENKSACESADMDFTPALAPRFDGLLYFVFYCIITVNLFCHDHRNTDFSSTQIFTRFVFDFFYFFFKFKCK